MRLFSFLIVLFSVCVQLSGCSTANIKSLPVQEAMSAAKIIIFRPNKASAMFNSMIVAIDDVDVAVLENEQYLVANVSQGQHKISVRGEAGLESTLTVTASVSEKIYLEAAGSVNNAVNFIPGSVLLKANFYVEQVQEIDLAGLAQVYINYE